MDLAERLSAVKAANDLPPDLTDNQAKTRFLEALCEGVPLDDAAKSAGKTRSWFKRRRNPDASSYDAEFALAYDRITGPGGEYRAAIVEDVFSAMVKAAKEGNVRAQEKILAAYSADFAYLRPLTPAGDINVQQLQVFFGELPLEKLMELKQARELARQREFPVLDQ